MLRTEKVDLKEKVFDEESGEKDSFSYEMVVFSPSPWGFVYQRPQHLISRISAHYKTLFIEAPVPSGKFDGIGFEMEVVSSQLSVLKPRVNSIAEIPAILRRLGIDHVTIAWFYTPAFAELLNSISAETIIYDCMNELSLFKAENLNLGEQEQQLLKSADLVMTAGISLYEEKSKYCTNVHYFPSSVDRTHFRKARENVVIPREIKNIKKPVIGYMGAVDERIDMPLLQETAELMPEYNFVMIGPWTKLEDQDLAQADNIYYLGMKPYKALPNYLCGFDVAMIPFVLDDSTRFANPAKTLEYMAADIPIISTPLEDVVRQYEDCVAIINSPKAFKGAVEKCISGSAEKRQSQYDAILEKTSWEHTAAKILKLIEMTD